MISSGNDSIGNDEFLNLAVTSMMASDDMSVPFTDSGTLPPINSAFLH